MNIALLLRCCYVVFFKRTVQRYPNEIITQRKRKFILNCV